MKGSVTLLAHELSQKLLHPSASGRLKKRITQIMQQPGRSPMPSVAYLLWLFSLGYGAAVKLRRVMYKSGAIRCKNLPCRVISIGNLTLGGTGKSPMTIFLARRLKQMGYRVAVCSRGYGGRASRRGGIVSDGRDLLMTPQDAGDEPVMMAAKLNGIPVVIGRDRYSAGLTAVNRFKVEILILDDGFQHLRLNRDINLLLMDSQRPFGNGHLFPRGVLREQVSAVTAGDAIVLTRSAAAGSLDPEHDLFKPGSPYKDIPVFTASRLPTIYRFVDGIRIPVKPEAVSGKRVLAFSGIARNNDFRCTLNDLGFELTGFLDFPDHYWYTDDDVIQIRDRRSQSGAEYIVTTEKDLARMHDRIGSGQLFLIVGVDISFSMDENAFFDFIKKRIEHIKGI